MASLKLRFYRPGFVVIQCFGTFQRECFRGAAAVRHWGSYVAVVEALRALVTLILMHRL